MLFIQTCLNIWSQWIWTHISFMSRDKSQCKSLQNESCLPSCSCFVSELWKVWKLYSTSFESFLKHTKLFHFYVLCWDFCLVSEFQVLLPPAFLSRPFCCNLAIFHSLLAGWSFPALIEKSRFFKLSLPWAGRFFPKVGKKRTHIPVKGSRKARSAVLLFLAVNISLRTESWLQVAQSEADFCERKALGTPVSHLKGSIAASIGVGSVLSPLHHS